MVQNTFIHIAQSPSTPSFCPADLRRARSIPLDFCITSGSGNAEIDERFLFFTSVCMVCKPLCKCVHGIVLLAMTLHAIAALRSELELVTLKVSPLRKRAASAGGDSDDVEMRWT